MLKTNAHTHSCVRAFMHDNIKGCAFLHTFTRSCAYEWHNSNAYSYSKHLLT